MCNEELNKQMIHFPKVGHLAGVTKTPAFVLNFIGQKYKLT